MNATIIHKTNVKGEVLDELAAVLPSIISEVLEVAGGKVAILKPQQVLLEFSEASKRDVGADIRVMLFARSNASRTSHENDLARSILEKIISLIAKNGEDYSIDVRLYLMEVGAADLSPAK